MTCRKTQRIKGDIDFPALASEVQVTAFQWQVLKATLEIPFGETRTYQWVAGQIGRPNAVRAVGTALRKNPWPLMFPCHRVIRSDGVLGKYAGRSDDQKKALLDLERSCCAYF